MERPWPALQPFENTDSFLYALAPTRRTQTVHSSGWQHRWLPVVHSQIRHDIESGETRTSVTLRPWWRCMVMGN